MNKIAEMSRLAEVRGTLAAFIDGGLLNPMDQESFDKLASEVADSFGENMDYTIEDVFTKTAEMFEEPEAPVEGEAVQEKTAAENLQFAMGGLLMNKLAGAMTDEQFADNVEALLKEAAFWNKKKVEEPEPAPKTKKEKAKEAINKVVEEGKKQIEQVGDAVAEGVKKHKKGIAIGAGVTGLAGLTAAGTAAYKKMKEDD